MKTKNFEFEFDMVGDLVPTTWHWTICGQCEFSPEGVAALNEGQHPNEVSKKFGNVMVVHVLYAAARCATAGYPKDTPLCEEEFRYMQGNSDFERAFQGRVHELVGITPEINSRLLRPKSEPY